MKHTMVIMDLFQNLLRRHDLGLGVPRNPHVPFCTLRFLRYARPQLTSARYGFEKGLTYGLLCLTFFLASVAFGHGGEDHSHSEPEVPVPRSSSLNSPSSRASTASDQFEAVLVFTEQTLRLALDRFASNAPVIGAKVELSGDGWQGVASEVSPGWYEMPAAALKPGRHAILLSVEAADQADLLSLTLDISVPPAAPEDLSLQKRWWGLGAALIVVLLTLFAGYFWMTHRRRKENRR